MDIHTYPGPAAPRIEEKRAGVLGEFGGLGLPRQGPHLAGRKELGLPQLPKLRGPHRRLPRPDPQAPPADRRARPCRRRLYADHGRRGRGQRPHDLRPCAGEDGRSRCPAGKQDRLHAPAPAPLRRRHSRSARHSAGRVRPVLQHLVARRPADRRRHHPLDRQTASTHQPGPDRRQDVPRHGREPRPRARARPDGPDGPADAHASTASRATASS